MHPPSASTLRRLLAIAGAALLAGCATAPHTTKGDPLQSFNRSMFQFNQDVDKAVIRPVAVGYRKVTNPPVRRSVSDFFTNIRLPISIANDLLQAKPMYALDNTGRFVVNLTLGLGGFFDPASHMGIPLHETDFGITLASWGVPDGPFLMLPLIGPTTARDVWRLPVDSYLFDPLSYYSRTHSYPYDQQYLPSLLYLVSLRAGAIDAESFLESAYDPYTFLRDAYLQNRTYMFYDGNPPDSVIEKSQDVNGNGGDFDPEELLKQQEQWKKQHSGQGGKPAASGSQGGGEPAPASSSLQSGAP